MTTPALTTDPSEPDAETLPWAWINCIRDMVDPSKNREQISAVEDKKLPVQLLPWLYLGDRQSSRQLAQRGTQKLSNISNNNSSLDNSLLVTHILALHPVAPYEEADMQDRLKGSGIVHKRVICDDSEGYDMIGKHWETCYEFLASVRQEYNDYMTMTMTMKKKSKDTTDNEEAVLESTGSSSTSTLCGRNQ